MFKNSFQSGLLSIFYSCSNKPLSLWGKQVKNGYVKRVSDEHVKAVVLEIIGNNVALTYISCPSSIADTLGIKLPFLIIIMKNLKKYFTFEIQVLDDSQVKRKFYISNGTPQAKIRNFDCALPISLNQNWNQIVFNLSEMTRKVFGTTFVECTRIHIHANCRLRRVYFADKLYSEEELPTEYKLYSPDAPLYGIGAR